MFGYLIKKLLTFASLISPSKMILFEKKYQTFDTVFHHQMKHLEVRQKYSAARHIFNSLLGVSSGDETLHLMFDILLLTCGMWPLLCEYLKHFRRDKHFTFKIIMYVPHSIIKLLVLFKRPAWVYFQVLYTWLQIFWTASKSLI